MERDYKLCLMIGLLVFTVLFIGLVLAGVLSTPTAEISFNESLTSNCSLTLNISQVSGSDTDSLNLTMINFTINSNFSYTNESNETNGTAAYANPAHIFNESRNASDLVLTFRPENATAFIMTNGSKQTFDFNLTSSRPGNYTLLITTLDTNDTVNSSTIYVYVNDTTPPNVTIDYPTNMSNLSTSSMVFNLTVNDAYTYKNLSNARCWYTLNNSGANNFSMANKSATAYNATNTTIDDGAYVATFYCNDSTGNINNSETITFVVDDTAPNIEFACTPSNVVGGETVTCECSANDPVSGVDTTTYNEQVTTVNEGTFTETCSVTDFAGNNGSADSSYTVERGSGGGGGSSGGGAADSSYNYVVIEDSKEFSQIGSVTKSLSKKTRVRIKINNKEHNVGVKELTETNATIEVFSTPQTAVFNVGEQKKFDATGDGYYDLQITLNSIASNKADVTIASIKEKVPESEMPAATSDEGVLVEESPKGWWGKWGLIIGIIVLVILVIVAIKIKQR